MNRSGQVGGLLLALALVSLAACAPSPAPSPRPSPAAGLLTRQIARHWQGPEIPWRAAVVDRLVDPGNPLGLQEGERRQALEAVRLYVVARERYMFRLGRLDRLLGERYRRPEPEPLPAAAEDVFLERIPPVLEDLESRAGRGLPPLAPYPDNLVLPHGLLGTEHQRPWDPEPGRSLDPAQLAALLEEIAPGLSPEEAGAVLVEARELETLVRDWRQGWLTMTSLATRGRRGSLTSARARDFSPEDSTADAMFDQAMAWLFENWDEAAAPEGKD